MTQFIIASHCWVRNLEQLSMVTMRRQIWRWQDKIQIYSIERTIL